MPIKVEPPYNPLDKKNLGVSVADALLARDPSPLPPAEPFIGAGVYAIYYFGAFAPYARIAAKNQGGKLRLPIYVGKAVPAGARKGGFGLDAAPGTVLYGRLVEHAESIKQAQSLRIEDFACRYLAVDDIWIPLGESLLIETFQPLWNRALGGFGNHDPGAGRHKGMRPAWDVVHPGRAWAERCAPYGRTSEQLLAGVAAFIDANYPQD